MEESRIILELSLYEALIIRKALMSHLPDKEDEMVSMMLYARITRKIDEKTGKHEPL